MDGAQRLVRQAGGYQSQGQEETETPRVRCSLKGEGLETRSFLREQYVVVTLPPPLEFALEEKRKKEKRKKRKKIGDDTRARGTPGSLLIRNVEFEGKIRIHERIKAARPREQIPDFDMFPRLN